MITRLSDSLLLQPRDIQPSQSGWEVIGAFNPAVAMVDDGLVMLARVAERVRRRVSMKVVERGQHPGEQQLDLEVVDVDLEAHRLTVSPPVHQDRILASWR